MDTSIGQTNVGPSSAPSRAATPPGLSLRDATAADAAAIAELGWAVFFETFAHTCSAKDMDDYLRANFTLDVIAAELADSAKSFIVAELDGRIVAFSCLARGADEPCLAHIPEHDRIELRRVYAAKAVHGTGVARALMSKTLERAAEYKHAWLGVWEHNYRARKFYERFGFSMVGSHDFMLGEDRQTDDIFLKTFE